MTGCDLRVCFLTAAFFSATALVACGGGGSTGPGGGTPATQSPTTTPVSTATPGSGATTTNATGTVVSDSSGLPLAGESVSLEPWVGGATPMPSPVATTNAQGGFTLSNVPNGHYLLVIGSNSTSDTSFATVHDNVTLTGGNQTLHAPTLPTIPTITAPAWETNGDYRISAIDPTTQLPCLTAFNADRATANLSQAVEDEWLLENQRDANDYFASLSNPSGSSYNAIVTPGISAHGGTSSCAYMLSFAFVAGNSYGGLTPSVQWFGGAYQAVPSVPGASFGLASFPADPRVTVDPVGVWP